MEKTKNLLTFSEGMKEPSKEKKKSSSGRVSAAIVKSGSDCPTSENGRGLLRK